MVFFCFYKRKMNRQEEQRVLDIAATAGRTPRRVASGRTILATGQGEGRKKYLVLANGDELTRAGEYWYEKTRQVKPNRHFDPNQETSRKGDGDYIQTSSGLRRVRQLGADGQMQFTALGKRYYKTKQTEYIVEIPVLIESNFRGKLRSRKDHLPLDHLGLPRIFQNDGLTEAQKKANIQSDVLLRLGGSAPACRMVLMEISEQRFYYDPDGSWLISSVTWHPPAGGSRLLGIRCPIPTSTERPRTSDANFSKLLG